MQKITVFLFLLMSMSAVSLQAQLKTMTIEQTMDRNMYPKSLSQLSLLGEENSYVYVDRATNSIMIGSPKEDAKTWLSLADLNEKLKAAGGTEQPAFPFISWKDKSRITFSDEKNLWGYDWTKKEAKKLATWSDDAEAQDFAVNGNAAFVVKGNLYVSDNLVIKQVTKDDGYQTVNGMPAHRSEFGIEKGTFWSPNGSKLAFYHMDQSMVTDYPLAQWGDMPATNKNIKYPMAGSKSHHVTVGIYDVKKGKTIYLQTGEPKEQYLTNITWSPDEKYVYIAIVNRDQNEMKLNRYDANSGKLDKMLFEEKHAKYVEPEHGVYFLPNKNDQFIWYSERDGFQHLYLFQTDGKLVKQLTEGKWMVEEILGFDKKAEHVFITARKESALELHAYKVSLKSGEMNQLTFDKGTHALMLSANSEYLLDSYSNLETPNISQLIETESGKVVKKIFTAVNPFDGYNTPEISLGTIKSTDGTTDLHYRIIKPINFDPNKKYPVMHYVYGGPHVQLVQNRWLGAADLFMMYMASQGFVVFTIDSRGSAGRGLEFENATHRQLGTMELADQMAGIEFLKKQPYVDGEKMAAFGWSFGGFMTTSLMLRHPNTFKVGVAGGPVIDWKFYEIMYTERYMDTPEQNPDGYKTASLLNYVDKLNGKLLIIHGLQDDTVVPQHTAAFVNETVAKGVLIDYLPYPNHPHNVRGKDRVHLYKKVADYIMSNLK